MAQYFYWAMWVTLDLCCDMLHRDLYFNFSLFSLFYSTGQHCTEDVNECRLQPNTCQNGGTCSNLIGSYVCVCVNGWSGPDCSENIDDCATAACSPGSTCIDRVASFVCLCPHGKTGRPVVTNHRHFISLKTLKCSRQITVTVSYLSTAL